MAPRQQHDPWNYWVFRVGANGYFNGESQQSQRSVSANLTANRVTERMKISLGLRGNNDHSRYDLDSVTTFINDTHSYGLNGSMVWSAGPHWSALGPKAAPLSSAYNYDLNCAPRAGPSSSTCFPMPNPRAGRCGFKYSIGVQYSRYTDTTIYGQTHQTLGQHSLEVSLDAKQPWGEAGISLSGSQYLHDLSR